MKAMNSWFWNFGNASSNLNLVKCCVPKLNCGRFGYRIFHSIVNLVTTVNVRECITSWTLFLSFEKCAILARFQVDNDTPRQLKRSRDKQPSHCRRGCVTETLPLYYIVYYRFAFTSQQSSNCYVCCFLLLRRRWLPIIRIFYQHSLHVDNEEI